MGALIILHSDYCKECIYHGEYKVHIINEN